MTRRVDYTPEARRQIHDLHMYISKARSVDVATAYITRIYDLCDQLADYPLRGRSRDELLPGLRTLGLDRRTLIAFAVTDDAVEILNVWYGGQDWQAQLAARG